MGKCFPVTLTTGTAPPAQKGEDVATSAFSPCPCTVVAPDLRPSHAPIFSPFYFFAHARLPRSSINTFLYNMFMGALLLDMQCEYYACKIAECGFFRSNSCKVINSIDQKQVVTMNPCPAKYLCSYCLQVPHTQVFGCFDNTGY